MHPSGNDKFAGSARAAGLHSHDVLYIFLHFASESIRTAMVRLGCERQCLKLLQINTCIAKRFTSRIDSEDRSGLAFSSMRVPSSGYIKVAKPRLLTIPVDFHQGLRIKPCLVRLVETSAYVSSFIDILHSVATFAGLLRTRAR